MQPIIQVLALQCDGHPDVVLRSSPTGTVLHKIPNGTAMTVLETLEDLPAQGCLRDIEAKVSQIGKLLKTHQRLRRNGKTNGPECLDTHAEPISTKLNRLLKHPHCGFTKHIVVK